MEVDGVGEIRARKTQAHAAEVGPEPRRAEGWRQRNGGRPGHRRSSRHHTGEEESVQSGASRADRRPAGQGLRGRRPIAVVAESAAVDVQRQQRHGQRTAAGRSADDREQPERADHGGVGAEEAGARTRGQASAADAQ